MLPGASNREAQVTTVINQANVTIGAETPRIISASEKLPDGAIVETAADARMELTFADQTLARLGGSTVFNFKNGTRSLDLRDGVMLLQSPKGARGTRIDTGKIAAVTAGSTIVFESHPTMYKFLVLQGSARMYRRHHLGDSVVVRAGQMVIGSPSAAVSEPVDFDVGRFAKSCRLINDFAALRSANLIAAESAKQQRAKSKKTLIDTNLVIFGSGSAVSLVNEQNAPAAKSADAADVPAAEPMKNTGPNAAFPAAVETAATVTR